MNATRQRPVKRGWRSGIAQALRRVATTLAPDSGRRPAAASVETALDAAAAFSSSRLLRAHPDPEPLRPALVPPPNLTPEPLPIDDAVYGTAPEPYRSADPGDGGQLVDPLERARVVLRDARRQMTDLMDIEARPLPVEKSSHTGRSTIVPADVFQGLVEMVRDLHGERSRLSTEVGDLRQLVQGLRGDLQRLAMALEVTRIQALAVPVDFVPDTFARVKRRDSLLEPQQTAVLPLTPLQGVARASEETVAGSGTIGFREAGEVTRTSGRDVASDFGWHLRLREVAPRPPILGELGARPPQREEPEPLHPMLEESEPLHPIPEEPEPQPPMLEKLESQPPTSVEPEPQPQALGDLSCEPAIPGDLTLGPPTLHGDNPTSLAASGHAQADESLHECNVYHPDPQGRADPRTNAGEPAPSVALELPVCEADLWLTVAPIRAIGALTALERRLREAPGVGRLVLTRFRRGEAGFRVVLCAPLSVAGLLTRVPGDGLAIQQSTIGPDGCTVVVRLADPETLHGAGPA